MRLGKKERKNGYMGVLLGILCCFALLGTACDESAEDPVPPANDPSLEGNNGNEGGNNEPDLQEPEVLKVRVATWNVRLFFDTQCDLGNCSEGGREEQPSEEEFSARADEIVEGIRAIDADVLILQEVETQKCIDALKERLGDEYTDYHIGEVREAASMDVAVLARADREIEVVTHRQDPFVREDGETRRFLREFLEIHLRSQGQEVIVFGGHFRSKVNDDPVQRRAEATRARQIVEEVVQEHPEALIVLGGDLNDTPGSDTLEILMDGDFMHRVAEDLYPDDWTINSNGRLNAIDHLLLVNGHGEVLPDSVKIVREGNALGGSDHAALVADFTHE